MELELLKKAFRQISALLLKGRTTEEIDSEEPITRFGFNTKDFNDKGEPKQRLFRYNQDDGCLSVYRTGNLSDNNIWSIGIDIQNQRSQHLIGRAEFLRAIIDKINSQFNVNLEIIPETSEHDLHANIINWPEAADVYLALRKEFAYLSHKSELFNSGH